MLTAPAFGPPAVHRSSGDSTLHWVQRGTVCSCLLDPAMHHTLGSTWVVCSWVAEAEWQLIPGMQVAAYACRQADTSFDIALLALFYNHADVSIINRGAAAGKGHHPVIYKRSEFASASAEHCPGFNLGLE